MTDLYLCYYNPLLGHFLGWPSSHSLLRYIGQAEEEGKDILTPDDLRGLFPSDSSLRRFLASYEKTCTIEVTDSDENGSENTELKELLLQMQTQMQMQTKQMRRMEMQLEQK